MIRLVCILIFLGFCVHLLGCSHTIDQLSRFNTGNVGARDIADAMVADEHDFRETFW